MHHDDARQVEWYELDSGAIVAVVVANGPAGLFLLPVGSMTWNWYAPGSDGWDAVHQRIFRQHQADRLESPPSHAPHLPASVPIAPIVDRDDVGAMRGDSSLIEWIAGGPSNTRTAFVALQEDPYESAMGDGLFRDFVACFPDHAGASACEIEPGRRRHLRRIELSVREGSVTTTSVERQDFADRYHVEVALADLVKRLKQG